jgi:hypothetical protein
MQQMRAWVLMLAACGTSPAELRGVGERWTAADAMFHAEPRWLGGDGAYAIDLGEDRTLWLFGDSFIATSPVQVRTESTMVRNSVAVMTGRDPLTATMQFAWRGEPPVSFFPEDGADWFWPADGVRIANGALVVFLARQRATPGDGLGFAGAGFRAVMVADPSGPPAAWQLAPVASRGAPYDPTASVACSTVDGEFLVALVTDGAAHRGRLARWPLVALAAADLSQPAWWTGTAWIAEPALAGTPAIVIDDGATECSLHQDPGGPWIHVASRGFGATTIAIRTATRLEGPWSDPTDVFTPPESSAPHAFVYAGKAHPMIAGDGLVVTYADNSFAFSDLLDPARATTLYWPHVAELTLSPR